MEKKIQGKEVGMGKGLHWMWDATSKIKNPCQNHPKSSCLKRSWNSNKPSSLLMEGKILWHYNTKVLKA
jgi:hypothetical protein